MASIIKRPNGHRWIQFVDLEKKHQTLRLGKVPDNFARQFKSHVETILFCRREEAPVPIETSVWLAKRDVAIQERLVRVGILNADSNPLISVVTKLAKPTTTRQRKKALAEASLEIPDRLLPMIDDWDGSEEDWLALLDVLRTNGSPRTLAGSLRYGLSQYRHNKKSTLRNMKRIRRFLLGFFDPDKEIADISPGDCEEFRNHVRSLGQAETTTSEICRKAKRFFEIAKDKGLIQTNPFHKMKGWTDTNDERKYFVDRPTIERLLNHCEPDMQLIIALIRYGGLRGPSEVEALRWEWVNFANDCFTIMAPKNERFPHKKFRVCPIFEDLKPFLESAWDRAEEGAEFVVGARYIYASDKALHAAVLRRVNRAGINPWPKLLINLRASRETELVDAGIPLHIVTAWLGNSPKVANKHYLIQTDQHFQRAITEPLYDKKAKHGPKQMPKQNQLR